MQKRYRESLPKVPLIISIVGVIIFAALFSFLTLRTPTPSTTPTYPKIKKELAQQFNSNGKVATVKEDRNINDKTSKKSHTVIIVILTDKQTQKYIKTTYEAVQNDTATTDQKLYIRSIQNIIQKSAKKLDNNYDVIQFVYKDNKSYIPVASSQKNKNLIPLVKTK